MEDTLIKEQETQPMAASGVPAVGAIRPDFISKNVVLGKRTHIRFANSEERDAQYALVPLDMIYASHNEKTFATTSGYPVNEKGENVNDRNYTDDVNAQANVVDVAQHLDPGKLIEYTKSPAGTPIISIDGMVVSGNNRVMSLKLAASDYPENFLKYLQELGKEMTVFGFIRSSALEVAKDVDKDYLIWETAEVYTSMKRPVLVRVDYGFPAYTTTELSKYNKDSKKTERPIDKAIKIGKIFTENEKCRSVVFGIIGDYETFSDFYKNLKDQKEILQAFIGCNLITQQEVASYFDEKTGFTPAGKSLVENAMAGAILDRDALLASDMEGVKRFKHIIITSLPVLARNQSLGEHSLVPFVNEAVMIEYKLKASDQSFEDSLRQQSIFDAKPSRKALVMNRLLSAGRNAFKGAIEGYNDSMDFNEGQQLFGDKPSEQEIYKVKIESKVSAEDLNAIDKALSATEATSTEPVSDQLPSSAEPIQQAEETPAQTDWFVNDNVFKEYPDNVLGVPYETSGRFGTVTKYKGDITDIARINAEENFIRSHQAENNPTVSTEQTAPEVKILEPQAANNAQEAINKSRKRITGKLKEKKEAEKPQDKMPATKPELQTIFEIDKLYNKHISNDDFAAFVWYRDSIGRRLSQHWYNVCFSRGITIEYLYDEETLKYWVKNGNLFYYGGEDELKGRANLITGYLALSGNMLEKFDQLEKDKENIVALYGEEAYAKHHEKLTEVFKRVKGNWLSVHATDEKDSLVLLPISEFARKFKIKTLADDVPFRYKEVSAASNKFYGEPDYLHPKFSDNKEAKDWEELSLQQAFAAWLVTDKTITFKKSATYFEIIKYYINNQNKPPYTNPTDKLQCKKEDAEWMRIQARAKDEGDRLFAIFMDTQLTAADKELLERQWNGDFNSFVLMDYMRIPIVFECAKYFGGEFLDILPEKREAAAMIFGEGSGCLAYGTGVGKTFSSIFTVAQFMYAAQQNSGSSRPLFCTPNQVYPQFLSEIKGVLPQYPINQLYNMGKDEIENLLDENGKVQPLEAGSISIMTYEGFRKLGFTEETRQDLLMHIYDILDQREEETGNRKQSEKKKAAFFERLENLVGRGEKGGMVNIEDLEIDMIIYDEAHRMKKIFTSVKGRVMPGKGKDGEEKESRDKSRYKMQSDPMPSALALKGFMITSYIMKKQNYSNIGLLTATPFTNSPLEIYAMLSLIAYHKLKFYNVNNLTDFFDRFIQVTTDLVINSRLEPERKQVVLGFNNTQSLYQLISRFINRKTEEDVGTKKPNKIVLPLTQRMENGVLVTLPENEQITTYLPMTPSMSAMMDEIRAYAKGDIKLSALGRIHNIEASAPAVDDDEVSLDTTEGMALDEDVMDADEKDKGRVLRGMAFARALSLSPYLYPHHGLGAPDYRKYVETSPKLRAAMLCIRSEKEWHERQTDPNLKPMNGVIIFMEFGTQYFELVRKYVILELGFTEREVDYITGSNPAEPSPRSKRAIQDRFLGRKFNPATLQYENIPDEDRIKVLIGSAAIEEGMNLQRYTATMHDLTPYWNPTNKLQRDGRLHRQGNVYKNVRICNWLVVDSMDIFIYQKLEEKTARINSVWQNDGKTNQLRLEEVNPQEMKYRMIRDAETLAGMQIDEIKERMEDEKSGKKQEISRIEAITGYMETVKTHFDRAQKWVEDYRKPRKFDAGMPIWDKARILAVAMNDIVKKGTNEEGKRIIYQWEYQHLSEKDRKRDDYVIGNKPSKQYYFDSFGMAARRLAAAYESYMKPKGLTMDDLEAYKKQLEQEAKEIEENIKKVGSKEAIEERAKEIEAEREAKQIRQKTLEEQVAEFASLNDKCLSEKSQKQKSPKELLQAKFKTCPPTDENGDRLTSIEALQYLEICIDNEPDSKIMNTEGDGQTYKPERVALHNRIIEDMRVRAECVSNREKPIAVLTGGSPASGKSYWLKKTAPYLTSDQVLHIDADEVRGKLPEYKGWNAFKTNNETKDLVNRMINEIGYPCKFDIVYDGTMGNFAKYVKLVAQMKKLGYRVFIVFLDVPLEVAMERAMKRYRDKGKEGRYVPAAVIEGFHKEEGAGKPTLEKLKKMVAGYIVIDGVSGTIIDKGGEEIPHDRPYLAKLSGETSGVKKKLLSAIELLKKA